MSHALMAALFPAEALPPAVRARVALLRAKAETGALVVTCGGRSMEPAIRIGDAVPVARGAGRAGAVAAFVTQRGELELHRLVARGPLGWWVHAGDNQSGPAPGLVHDAQVVGIAEVPARRPSIVTRARAAARLARAAVRVTLRRG